MCMLLWWLQVSAASAPHTTTAAATYARLPTQPEVDKYTGLPTNWSAMPADSESFLAQVSQATQEYTDVVNYFLSSVPHLTVLQVTCPLQYIYINQLGRVEQIVAPWDTSLFEFSDISQSIHKDLFWQSVM